MRRTTTLLIAITLVLAACAGDEAATTTAAPEPTATTEASTTTEAVSMDPRDVTFTSGGFALEATEWPGGTTWVVLGHMLPADKDAWTGLAEQLQEAGYSVLAYNNRGYGASEGDREPFALYTDAAAAITYAQEGGARQIVYGGASMNAANAMKLGVYYDFAGIVALSPVRTFPSAENALSAAFDVYEPTLFVAAEDDGDSVDVLDRFLDQISGGGDWIVIPRGGHGTDMLDADLELVSRIVDWVIGLGV
jgi:pimeloyl-ACP methyl ester carboxylesterase